MGISREAQEIVWLQAHQNSLHNKITSVVGNIEQACSLSQEGLFAVTGLKGMPKTFFLSSESLHPPENKKRFKASSFSEGCWIARTKVDKWS